MDNEHLTLIIVVIAAAIMFPAFILYSRFIYNKYGVFITKFNHPKYHPKNNFKEFIEDCKANWVFGYLGLFIWLSSIVFFFVQLWTHIS